MSGEYTGPERRKHPRVLPYHPDDSRTWHDAGRKLIFTTERYRLAGYLRRVLCQIEGEEKWVIWEENLADSERVGHPATFGGDYHFSLLRAVIEFFHRAEKDGLKVLVP